MRIWRLVPFVAACLLLLAWGSPAIAQETRGSIEGVVKDSSGGVLPGVVIRAKQMTTAATQQSVTNGEGAYRFPALAPGSYSLTAELSGFKDQTIDKVDVAIGQLLKLNITMALAGLATTTTVVAETPIVDVKQNSVTAKITSELIDLLPKGRDFQSVLNGIAGTNYETDITGSRATGVMVDGASQSENRFLIDGQDTTDLRNGMSGKGVAVDFVDQIQVKQSGYNAEFRATTGGVVSVITKSGGNVYHGDAAMDYNGKRLNRLAGHIRPAIRLDPSDSGLNPPAQYFTTPRTSEYERETIEPVYDIGGPILKNRAWFYLGYNNALFNQDRTVQWANPVVNGVTYPAIQTFNAKTTDFRYLYNGTWQLSQNLRLRGNGNNQRTTSAVTGTATSPINNALPGIDTASFKVDDKGNTLGISNSNAATFNPRPTNYNRGFNNSYSTVVDWNVNSRTYANFQTGFLGSGNGVRGSNFFTDIRRTFGQSNINLVGLDGTPVPAAFQFASGYADNSSNTFTEKDNFNRFNLSGNITRYATWRGRHAFKIGAEYERYGNDVVAGQHAPNITFNWNQTRTTLDQRLVRGNFGYFIVGENHTEGAIHSVNKGFFLQDQWTFNERLTINYGVRFDNTSIPSYRAENPGITFGWSEKVAPRLGFAYDVKGNSKWKMFGSWGIFYDIEKLEMPRGAWGAEHINNYYWTLDTYDWPSIKCAWPPSSSAASAIATMCTGNGNFGTYIEQNDLRHVSNDPNNNLVDPNLKPYQAREFVLGLDHELNRLMSVGTRYVHKWVASQGVIEDVGVQVVGIGEVFYIANPGYGLGAYPLGTAFPRTPFPQRDYDALELNFSRRFSHKWSVSSNITFSRLFGNYSGLSNSTSESNRNSPNVTRLFDGLFMSFTEKGCPDRVNCDAGTNYGLISTDRPVVWKVQGVYQLPWGTSAGVDFNAQSGNLQTTLMTYKAVPVMIYAPGDLQRTPIYTNTNLNFSQTFRLTHGLRMTGQFNITNLFDQDFTTSLSTTKWRDALLLAGDNCTLCAGPFFNGFDADVLQKATNQATNLASGRLDPRYGLASGFRGARTARFYVKFSF